MNDPSLWWFFWVGLVELAGLAFVVGLCRSASRPMPPMPKQPARTRLTDAEMAELGFPTSDREG